ncbi:MAG: hypothetical protein HQL87_03465 [Magnetococcales bacterium]|nr:hypothetical protein [Magnetococcales bacterium]
MKCFQRYARMLAMLPVMVLSLMIVSAWPSQAVAATESMSDQSSVKPMILAQNGHRNHKCVKSCSYKYRMRLHECERHGAGRHCIKEAKRHYHHCLEQCN